MALRSHRDVPKLLFPLPSGNSTVLEKRTTLFPDSDEKSRSLAFSLRGTLNQLPPACPEAQLLQFQICGLRCPCDLLGTGVWMARCGDGCGVLPSPVDRDTRYVLKGVPEATSQLG